MDTYARGRGSFLAWWKVGTTEGGFETDGDVCGFVEAAGFILAAESSVPAEVMQYLDG